MEVLIDNRNGEVFDIPVTEVSWGTKRVNEAGVFDATLVLEEPLKFPIVTGAVLRATDGNSKVFYGYIFDVGYSRDSTVKIKAYDQLKYLMNNDTFVIGASTATNAIKRIASGFGLRVGTFQNTGYVVPGIVEDDKQAFDVVLKYLDATLIAINQNFILYDNFGLLDLRNIYNMVIPADDFYLGEDSLLFDFTYNKSIDKDTANRIKLVHDNKDTGKREVYIVQDSANIKKWGLLQEFRKVDENMAAAQIRDLANRLAKVKNRETKTLDISCLGNWKVRAGSMVYIYVEKIGIKEYFLVDECTHNWNEGIHTMELKVKVI